MAELELRDLLDEVTRRSGADVAPLDRLACAVAVTSELTELADALLGHFVEAARAEGASWVDIGDMLGITKQGAQQRFVRDERRAYRKVPDRWAPHAKSALVAAQREARAHRHRFLGTEHLLLGLVADDEMTSVKALRRLGAPPKKIRRTIDVLFLPPGDREVRGRQPLTPRSRRAVMLAGREARDLGHGYIGTEHLLIGVALVRGGVAAEALADLGLHATSIRDAVIELCAGPPVGSARRS